MSAEPATGVTMDTEPLVFFHATLAGLAPSGKIQPIPGPVPFEEEPAVWAEVTAEGPSG
jgi:hypothetical protein